MAASRVFAFFDRQRDMLSSKDAADVALATTRLKLIPPRTAMIFFIFPNSISHWMRRNIEGIC
ncbi:MAG TPA: hypothetical protein VJS38_03880 [Phenylobacterium sp.]|nr:hypothetical protein [Phenylobacterium sp.]